jgi:hypothetical protein
VEVLQDVHEVDDDRDLDPAFLGFELDPLDLVVGAVHERDPRAAVLGVAPLCFLEDAFDHGRGCRDNAGGQPLVGGDRSGGGLVAFRLIGCEDVGHRARRRRRVVDRADLGHPLVVERLAARQPGFGLGAGAGRPGGGGGAQRVGAHHDPLAVGREHQQIPALAAWCAPRRIEVLEVDRGELGELLDLAFTQPLPGLALDRIGRVLEAAAPSLQRGQLAQPVRVTLDRQVQRRVGGMQVPQSGRAVRQPLDRHGPEHRLKRTSVPALDPATRHPLIADHPLEALLADRPQRQMVIQQPPQQLPSVAVKTVLELGVREPRGVRPIQETQQRLELLTARTKASRYGRIARRVAAAATTSRCTIATRPPGRQDFTARGVKLATTGVEIGGHVGHLRGRRWT